MAQPLSKGFLCGNTINSSFQPKKSMFHAFSVVKISVYLPFSHFSPWKLVPATRVREKGVGASLGVDDDAIASIQAVFGGRLGREHPPR